MEKIVSLWIVEAVLAPICEPRDPVYQELSSVDGESEAAVKAVLKKYVRPYFDSFDERSQVLIKDSVSYCTMDENLSFGHTFDALGIPFEPPHEIRIFYRWLKDEIAPDWDIDVKTCVYTDDLSVAHRLRRKRLD